MQRKRQLLCLLPQQRPLQSQQQPVHLQQLSVPFQRQFWLLLLNHSLIPIKEVCVGRGGLTMTAVDVKIVVREALLNNSSAMMLFHNHPSGNLRPSAQDEQLTRRIKDACDLLDIRVLDHIVVANHRYYSFHDEGKL